MISPTVEKLAQNLSKAGPAHTPESPACTPVPRPLTQRLGGCSVPPDSGSGPREDRPVPHPCPGRSSWSADITRQRDHRHPAAPPLQQICPLRAGKAAMEPESLYNLLHLPGKADPPAEEELLQGEKRKFLPPTSRSNPKFEELQKVLMDWINAELLPEHIVVRSLEEDIFDGLILHHLFQKLSGLKLDVEEIALTAASQRRKLTAVLESVDQSLRVEEPQAKWSVESIFRKDLLATLNLLVALAKHFQPDLPLPTNVQVEVITMEHTKSGLKSEKSVEQLTEGGPDKDQPSKDVFDELFKLAPEKVNAVKEAIVKFVNQELDRLGLSVQNLDTQFADGVILLLLIGQLEGFFLHLKEFYLTPSSPAEMLHNVTLALELLKEGGLLSYPVNPEDIVNKDAKSTLRVLYSLFRKHKLKESTDGVPQRSPN